MTAQDAQQRLAELLSRTALGDRAAFAELYGATRAKLFAVSLRIVRERALAEEALQDSYVSIWHHASDYARLKGAPTTWMAAIVRNRSLDLVRRARELPEIDDALERCLQELDAEQRQSIALAFFHGLTHSELAAHLHRPLGTVKTHVRRGLLKLRDCLMRAGQR